MSTIKIFNCPNCNTEGKIVVKSEDIMVSDLVYCPCCAGSIYEDDDDFE